MDNIKYSFEYLDSQIKYNPTTGLFFWKCSGQGRKVFPNKPVGNANGQGYIEISINRKKFQAHRLAWFLSKGRWPEEVDHINHNISDNRLLNLREVTHSENQHNQKIHKNNTTGVHGVSYSKRDKKYEAHIRLNGKSIFLGYFFDLDKAKKARQEAETKYFGEFAPNYKLFI